ncbi:MAG TPA: hypothetical protein VFQ87_01650 [Bradyrhizobium sp.]|jgi:hypothetical protein|nr:hypothetical protein [Bradyrhizobium sp.]
MTAFRAQFLLSGGRGGIDLNHIRQNSAGHSGPGVLRLWQSTKISRFRARNGCAGFFEATGNFSDADWID